MVATISFQKDSIVVLVKILNFYYIRVVALWHQIHIFIFQKGVFMIVDLNFDEKDQAAVITFFPKEFSSPGHYSLALIYLTIIAGEYDLDPEMSEDDLREMIEGATEKNQDAVAFVVSEDGIEVDAHNSEI